MFIAAIERATAFTRPIHTIARFYGSTTVIPGAATLFFVNADGWALTCKHVADELIGAEQLAARYNDFRAKRAAIKPGKKAKQFLKTLERDSGIQQRAVVEVYNNFMNCIEGPLDVGIQVHPELDVALLHFRGFTKLLCTDFPTFAADDAGLKQGKSICRLGFPFAEFDNFEYDLASDRARWTQVGRLDTPRFPIEGMVTRHLLNQALAVVGFELSTPGLRGQSGGPAFDTEGRIWGMQSRTNHLDLNFDVNMEVLRDGQATRIKDHAVLHVGHCVHVSALKAFMQQHRVQFTVG